MPSNEYLQQVTTGEVEELNGEIVRCEYDESWAKMYFQEHEDIENALNGNSMSIEHVGSISVQGLCAKPILVIILFSAQRDKYASCEKLSHRTHGNMCRIMQMQSLRW